MIQFLPLLGPVVERLAALIPDPAARERAIAQAQSEMHAALQALDTAQLAVNRAEAESGNLFIGGWRPAIGWICAAALAWSFAIGPVIKWGLLAAGQSAADLPPTVMDGNLWELILAMLGMSTLRTYEKLRGIAAGTPAQAAPPLATTVRR